MPTPSTSSLSPWFGRALVEGTLIVFAVVLGFIVNEWREDVADRRAAHEAMGRVVAEIESNIRQLESVVVYHEDVVQLISERIAELEAVDEPVMGTIFGEMDRVMPRGINAPGLSSFAWNHAQQHGQLDSLPYEVVAETARIYVMQANGVDSTWRQIVDLLFDGPEVMVEKDLKPPLEFTQIGFAELAAQERYLIRQLEHLLERLREEGF